MGHASTPPLSFLQSGCPSCRPTNSVKALKGFRRPTGGIMFSTCLSVCVCVCAWKGHSPMACHHLLFWCLLCDTYVVCWEVHPSVYYPGLHVYLCVKVKVKANGICSWQLSSLLRELTYYMGSHSVTCCLAEVTFPPLYIRRGRCMLSSTSMWVSVCVPKCPVQAPGHNAPLIQFLILALYILFAC